MYVFVGEGGHRLAERALLSTLCISFRHFLSLKPPSRTVSNGSRTALAAVAAVTAAALWVCGSCVPAPLLPTTYIHTTPPTPTRPTVTFWTWYTTTAYFCLSCASAYLCWRAIGKRTSNAIVTANNERFGKPVPPLLERLQLVAWNVACVASLIVVTLYWLADVSEMKIVHVEWSDLPEVSLAAVLGFFLSKLNQRCLKILLY